MQTRSRRPPLLLNNYSPRYEELVSPHSRHRLSRTSASDDRPRVAAKASWRPDGDAAVPLPAPPARLRGQTQHWVGRAGGTLGLLGGTSYPARTSPTLEQGRGSGWGLKVQHVLGAEGLFLVFKYLENVPPQIS